MVTERILSFRLPFFYLIQRLPNMMSIVGFDLRGSAPVGKTGLGDPSETMIKATFATVVLDMAVPAGGRMVRLCPVRAKSFKNSGPAMEVFDIPCGSTDLFFPKSMAAQQTANPTNNESSDNHPIGNDPAAITSNDDQKPIVILRLDLEVQFILEQERINFNNLLDIVIEKIVTAVMQEQRAEAIKQDDKIEDIQRITNKRDDAMAEQLFIMIGYIRAIQLDGEDGEIQQAIDKTFLIEKDRRDGQPTVWAEAVANNDDIETTQHQV